MKKVVLINTREFPCPGSHLLHTRKFLSSFSRWGYEFSEVRNLDQILELALNKWDVVYFSDHGLSNKNFLTDEQVLTLGHIRQSGAFPIFWYWFQQVDLLSDWFQSRWILTGEHFLAKEVLDSHRMAKGVFDTTPNFIPLRFAANFTSEEIGSIKRDERFKASFVGHRYKRTLNAKLRFLRRGIKVVYTPPFIPENNRINIFSSSRTVLGWHSDGNIANGVVVERIFEGLALGSVVVSDNPYAKDLTDGIVEYAYTLQETLAVIDKAHKDYNFFKLKQEQGTAFAKSKGTYTSVSKSFVDRILDS